MSEKLSLAALGVMTFFCLYASIMIAEFVGNTPWFLYLRNDVGVSVTLFRVVVESLTALPLAYLTGSWVIRRSPTIGRKAILYAAVAFAIIIGVFQITIYEPSVWSSSLLKVIFPVGGLFMAHVTQATVARV